MTSVWRLRMIWGKQAAVSEQEDQISSVSIPEVLDHQDVSHADMLKIQT